MKLFDTKPQLQTFRTKTRQLRVNSAVDQLTYHTIVGWATFETGFSITEAKPILTFGGVDLPCSFSTLPRPDVANGYGLLDDHVGFSINFEHFESRSSLGKILVASDEHDIIVFRLIFQIHGISITLFDVGHTAKVWLEHFHFLVVDGVIRDLSGLSSGASVENESREVPKLIAYYLPQFYPFEENDKWWGTGYTEWHGLAQARPNFDGHRVPNLPSDLGFYDLRLRDVRRKQGDLAKYFGIDGFCYYYYWFSGKRLMRDVLDDIILSGEPNLPFCICWANEPWSRRWDGSETEVLMSQDHSVQTDQKFIHDIMSTLKNRRYIKVGNKPLLLIYRISLLDQPKLTLTYWREQAIQQGFDGLHILACDTFEGVDVSACGVDGIAGFPPHRVVATQLNPTDFLVNTGFTGKIYDYEDVLKNNFEYYENTNHLSPGVMPHWDNTSRKRSNANIFVGSTPSMFQQWVELALARSSLNPVGERFVFINSWNEWAEGAQLEPSMNFGKSYLNALQSAKQKFLINSLEGNIEKFDKKVFTDGGKISRGSSFEKFADLLRYLGLESSHVVVSEEFVKTYIETVMVDRVNLVRLPDGSFRMNNSDTGELDFIGWAGLFDSQGDLLNYAVHQSGLIFDSGQDRYFVNFDELVHRSDVLAYFGSNKLDVKTGFRLQINSSLERGRYSISVAIFEDSKFFVSSPVIYLVVT